MTRWPMVPLIKDIAQPPVADLLYRLHEHLIPVEQIFPTKGCQVDLYSSSLIAKVCMLNPCGPRQVFVCPKDRVQSLAADLRAAGADVRVDPLPVTCTPLSDCDEPIVVGAA